MAIQSEPEESMPIDAVGLVRWMEREHSPLSPLHIRAGLHDEIHRLELSAETGVRQLIATLKARYKLT